MYVEDRICLIEKKTDENIKIITSLFIVTIIHSFRHSIKHMLFKVQKCKWV